jgi:hypothetical protein
MTNPDCKICGKMMSKGWVNYVTKYSCRHCEEKINKSKIATYLIDCLGYSEQDCDEMNKNEMLFIINDNGYLKEFNDFIS